MNPIEVAVQAVGGVTIASSLLNISYVATKKMVDRGMLPRTDYTGETNYAEILAKNSKGAFTEAWLLEQANPKNFVA